MSVNAYVRLRHLILIVLVVASAVWPVTAAATTYRVRPLVGYWPAAINRWGTVAATAPDGSVVVIKRHSQTTIPLLAGTQSLTPTAISDSGIVVGTAWTGDGERPFAWTRDRGTWDLGGPLWSCERGYQTVLRPVAVNASGLAVGVFEDADCNTQPVWWNRSGMHLLAAAGRAADVNEQGQAVGTHWGDLMANGQNRASGFVWQRGHRLRLFRVDHSDTEVYAINDEGVMIGATHLYDSVTPDWLWVPGHRPRMVPNTGFTLITNRRIYGGVWSAKLGTTLFRSWNTYGRDRRSIRLRGGGGGWQLIQMISANDRGQILAWAFNQRTGPESQGVLLTPVR